MITSVRLGVVELVTGRLSSYCCRELYMYYLYVYYLYMYYLYIYYYLY